MILHLAKTHDLQPDDVEAIEVMPHLRRLPHTDNPDPRTSLAAKFSIQYCVARALTDRAVRLHHFEGDAMMEPAVRALLPRVKAFGHPDMPADSDQQWGAEVVVHTRDGRRLASRIDNYERPGPGGRMLTDGELWTKFSDCAERALPRSAIAPLYDALCRVVALPKVTDLTTLMRYPELRSKAA
jgi:2-methylcitrate dehydratase PrpD